MNYLNRQFKILKGAFSLLFGFCPECNSDAPKLYTCNTCVFNKIPKEQWWERFINNLK